MSLLRCHQCRFAQILELSCFYSGMMANTLIKWVTMTYFLCGTIVCVSLYLLSKFTTVDVIEQENMFTRSPNAILKIVPITMVSELPAKLDVDFDMKQKEPDCTANECDASETNSITIVTENGTEAAEILKIVNHNQIENNLS